MASFVIRMKFHKNKLLTAVAAAALTFGVAACGGGSSSDEAVAPGGGTPPPPTDAVSPPTAAEQLTMAQDAVTAAETAVANATTPDQISAAYAALAAAQAQLATAESIPENQIALLRDRINQIQMDLNDATMLAGQRDSVGTALTAAQTAVSGLTESSSDADANMAGDLVAAVEAALAAATALPETDALRSSVAAVADAFAGVQMDRTLYTQRGMVDGPLAAAQDAVGGLSNTSSMDDVAAAEAAVMAAQTALAAASALPADDPRHDLVAGVYNDLGTAKTDRTAHMETGAINDLIGMAQTAVGGLNQVTSSVQDVVDARTAVHAAANAIAEATALTAEQRTELSTSLAADAGDELAGIDTYRNSPAGSLEVAKAALAYADGLVMALTSSSTADEARAAYQALADAQVALRLAEANPENRIADLNKQVTDLSNKLGDSRRASAAVATATAAVAGVNNDSLAEDVTAARTALDNAKTALANAANLAEADRTGLQGAIDSLESTLSAIETVVAARPDPMVVAADTAAAETKEMAIATEAGQELVDDAGLGGTANAANYGMTISREKDMAATIKITDTDNAEDDDRKFMQVMDLGSGRTMHRRDMEADDDGNVVQEIVIVSTDIEEPTDIPFVMADGKGRYTLDANPDPDEGNANQSLDFAAAHVGLAMLTDSRVTVPAPSGSVTLMGDDDDTEDVKENEYSGTFDGAEGTFTCTVAGGCAVTVADGEITDMASVYFTPEEDVTVEEDDAEYLNYGFWLKKTTDDEGVTTYNEVETFAGSEAVVSDVDNVTGSATYKGGATGVYVHSVTKTDGTRESATAGQFKADAELTATFGQVLADADEPSSGTLAPNLLDTITGTVNNFVLEHGEEHRWSVSLEKAGITVSPNDVPHVEDGVAKGGGADGSYTATLHGPTERTVDEDTVNIPPHSVVGEFNANFSNGSAVGAYGARKQN